MTTFEKIFADHERRKQERIRQAGKHRCIKTKTGTLRRLTGSRGRILKRPVVLMRFYECKICGREME